MLTTSLLLLSTSLVALASTTATCYSFSQETSPSQNHLSSLAWFQTSNSRRDPHEEETQERNHEQIRARRYGGPVPIGRAQSVSHSEVDLQSDATAHARPGVDGPAAGASLQGRDWAHANKELTRTRRALRAGARQRPSAPGGPANSSSARQADSAEQQAEPTVQPGRGIKNVTAQNGQSVLLHCLVEPNEAGELPEVSWFRGTGEPQLLTYETTTIIKDERFLVRPGISRPNDWALQIKNLDKSSDAGLYQCQTSGDSPQLQSYQLNIVEPQVSILGSPDLALRVGQPINLTCVISQSADQLQFVFWYRDLRMINYDLAGENRGKIVSSKLTNRPDSVSSNLQIFESRPTDSGNYTCAPSGARSTSIYVHVLDASDKRLIMFQNDETNSALSASSQHQTNSAISVHIVRLSRGRAYAIFAALLIFASWFQLVAQIQTGISLLLLAIIGVFLSNQPASNRRRDQKGRPARKSSEGTAADLTGADGRADGEQTDELADPLLERAREALDLLRGLGELERGSSPCPSSVELDEHELHGFRALSLARLTSERRREASGSAEGSSQPVGSLRSASSLLRAARPAATTIERDMTRRAGRINQTAQAHQEAQASPSGSSSSSSNSTGYNSDSHTSGGQAGRSSKCSAGRKSRPSVSLVGESSPARGQSERGRRELEMIELLKGRPTALKLIIGQLERRSRQENSKGQVPSGATSGPGGFGRELKDESAQSGGDAPLLPASGICSNQNKIFTEMTSTTISTTTSGENELEVDAEEQIYSVPSSSSTPLGLDLDSPPPASNQAQNQHHAPGECGTSATFERPD